MGNCGKIINCKCYEEYLDYLEIIKKENSNVKFKDGFPYFISIKGNCCKGESVYKRYWHFYYSVDPEILKFKGRGVLICSPIRGILFRHYGHLHPITRLLQD